MNPLASLDTLMGMLSITNPELKGLLEAKTEDAFVEVFERGLERAIRTIESNAKHYTELGEIGFSHMLASLLRAAGFSAEADPLHRGHVDFKVEAWFQPAWKCLGECKIFDHYAYHIKGLKQLLGYGSGAQAKLPHRVLHDRRDVQAPGRAEEGFGCTEATWSGGGEQSAPDEGWLRDPASARFGHDRHCRSPRLQRCRIGRPSGNRPPSRLIGGPSLAALSQPATVPAST